MMRLKEVKQALKIFICCAVVLICVFLYSDSLEYIYVHDNAPALIADIPVTKPTEVVDIPEISENLNVVPDLIIEELREFNGIDGINEIEDVMYYKKKHVREMTVSMTGDLTLASNYVKPYGGSFYEYYDLYGPGYYLENVAHIFNESDYTVANLECALTDNPETRKNGVYCYRGPTEYTSILTAGGIDAVNLSNNHSFDYSQEGYDATVNALETAGIGYFGNGAVLIEEINGIKVGFTSSVGEGTATVKPALDYMEKNKVDIKIVTFHWGIMDERVANSSQRAAAHYAIDCGADLVIGHHPHVLQGIEVYNGKYIAYSLGNFIFDGNVVSDIENRTSIIFQQKFVLYGTDIIDSSINIIPINVTSVPWRNDFKPIIVDGEQKEAILNKIEARSVY